MIKNILLLLLGITACTSENTNLKVSLLNDKPSQNIIVKYEGFDKGRGNTSIAFDGDNIYKWSGESPYNPFVYINSATPSNYSGGI